MGTTIHTFDIRKLEIPKVIIERWVDIYEKQNLTFCMDDDARIITETGNYITIFGRDRKGVTVEIQLPISVDELIEKLMAIQK